MTQTRGSGCIDTWLAKEDRLHTGEPASIDRSGVAALARSCGLTLCQAQRGLLAREITPERYRRNIGTLGWQGQMAALNAHVTVIGSGGLGGFVIEALARLGIGELTLVDGDAFQESNLNRQLGCTVETLHRLKVDVLAERVAVLNPAVTVHPHVAWFSEANGAALVAGRQVVIDALDSIPTRLLLQRIAAEEGVPLVHGAIAGWTGQVMTIMPGDHGIRAIYGEAPRQERGIETELGTPPATPMLIAAWMAQECAKLITGKGILLRGRLLLIDALHGDLTELNLGL